LLLLRVARSSSVKDCSARLLVAGASANSRLIRFASGAEVKEGLNNSFFYFHSVW
jgi:hypothetical protein